MPDRSRYPWLPRENVVDPAIFTELNQKKKLPTPDQGALPDNDPQAAALKVTNPPKFGAVSPPVAPPPPPSPVPEPDDPNDEREISGQTHTLPPPPLPPTGKGSTMPQGPTIHIGPLDRPPNTGPIGGPPVGLPVGIPPVPTPSDPNLNTTHITYTGIGAGAPVTRSGGVSSGSTINPPPKPGLPPMPTMGMGPVGAPGGPTDTTGVGNAPIDGSSGGFPIGPPPSPPSPLPSPVPPEATHMPGPTVISQLEDYPGDSPDSYGKPEEDESQGFDDEEDRDYEEMAKGGVIRRPTRVKLGEAGPEAVVPVGPRMKYNWRSK